MAVEGEGAGEVADCDAGGRGTWGSGDAQRDGGADEARAIVKSSLISSLTLGGECDVVSEVGDGGVRVVGNTTVCSGGVGVAGNAAVGDGGITMGNNAFVGDGGTTTGGTAICVESVTGTVLGGGETAVNLTAGCWESMVGATVGSGEATGGITINDWGAELSTFPGAAGEVP